MLTAGSFVATMAAGSALALTQHHVARSVVGASGFATIATGTHAGATTDATGKPDWLPPGATLVRHDIDPYGLHVWLYALPGVPSAADPTPVMLRICAVASASLQAPADEDPATYTTTPQDVGGNPGQALSRRDGGLQRIDFLRDGVAYTVIATSGGGGHATPPPDLATVLHVAQSLEP